MRRDESSGRDPRREPPPRHRGVSKLLKEVPSLLRGEGAPISLIGGDTSPAALADNLIDQLRARVAAREPSLSKSYFSRDRGLRTASSPVWQTKIEQLLVSEGPAPLGNPLGWCDVEREAQARLRRTLSETSLTVLDIEVRKAKVRRFGTALEYRVTIGRRGDSTDERPPPRVAPTALAAVTWGDHGPRAAIATVTHALLNQLQAYPSVEGRLKLPFRRRYTRRDSKLERTDFDVWQATTSLSLDSPAAADALIRAGKTWDRVEEDTRENLQLYLSSELLVMDVYFLELERRRSRTSLEARITVRRAPR